MAPVVITALRHSLERHYAEWSVVALSVQFNVILQNGVLLFIAGLNVVAPFSL